MFDGDEAMKEVGGPAYLAQLTGSGAAVIGARDFATQIYDLALLRALVGVGRDMVEGALDTSEEVAPLTQIERAESELYKVAEQGGGEGKVKSFGDASKEALRVAEAALNSGGGLSGITTGLDRIQRPHGRAPPLRPRHPRRPSGHGQDRRSRPTSPSPPPPASCRKSPTASSRSARPAPGSPSSAWKCRPTSSPPASSPERSEIPGEQIRAGKIGRNEFTRFARAASELNSLPLYIDDTPALTIAALRARARRLKRQKGIGMIVVDYLQLLQGTGRNSNDNRVQEISEISRGLKQLAKELHVPVLALSQFCRAVEQREDKRPQLSDLRESGSIEQDADIVLFVYREDYYLAAKQPADDHPDAREMAGETWSAPTARRKSSSPSSATARPARSSSSSTAASPSSATWRTMPICRRCAARERAARGGARGGG